MTITRDKFVEVTRKYKHDFDETRDISYGGGNLSIRLENFKMTAYSPKEDGTYQSVIIDSSILPPVLEDHIWKKVGESIAKDCSAENFSVRLHGSNKKYWFRTIISEDSDLSFATIRIRDATRLLRNKVYSEFQRLTG